MPLRAGLVARLGTGKGPRISCRSRRCKDNRDHDCEQLHIVIDRRKIRLISQCKTFLLMADLANCY
jgi:hypothetical protein